MCAKNAGVAMTHKVGTYVDTGNDRYDTRVHHTVGVTRKMCKVTCLVSLNYPTTKLVKCIYSIRPPEKNGRVLHIMFGYSVSTFRRYKGFFFYSAKMLGKQS